MEANQLSVLVVEDDPATSRLLRHNLESAGTQVVAAASGLECIRILCRGRVDLLLLDLGLPDFSGWDILSALRRAEPLRDIPVIVVSVEPPNPTLVAQFRPDDYIQKPFDMRDLLVRVRRVIDSRLPIISSVMKGQDGVTRNPGAASGNKKKKEGEI